jgi:hypothetical protein
MTRESSTALKILRQVNEEDGITADKKTAANCRGVPIAVPGTITLPRVGTIFLPKMAELFS